MLSETIYQLRRSRGLSQEQLAERLGVSRQAVSKWESGQSVPELDKLVAVSQFFGVTVDDLTTGKAAPLSLSREPEEPSSGKDPARVKLGVVLCLTGAVLLILLGVLLLCFPSASGGVNDSFAFTLNGSGALALLFAAVMAAGVILVVKKK